MTSQHTGARRGRTAGFALVELLVAVAVLGILTGLVVLGVARFRGDAQDSGCQADLAAVTRAATAYQAVTGRWPSGTGDLVEGGYLRSVPAGSYRFDPAARTVSREPGCATSITGIGGKCAQVTGAAVQLAACTGDRGQQWRLPPTSPGAIAALGGCLSPAGGATANRTPVELVACTDSGAQQWSVRSDGSIVHVVSGRCLDAENASSANGTRLIIWDCHGESNQLWVLG